MSAVYLSLGSNIRPEINIPAAIDLLKKNFHVLKISSVYETDPVGPAGNLKFWNLAVSVQEETRETLRKKIRAVEADLGRLRGENKFAPRTIDIDILPQEGFQKLAFIMIPLAEIAPNEIDSATQRSYSALAEELSEDKKKFRQILV